MADFNTQVVALGRKLAAQGMVYRGEAIQGVLLEAVLNNAPGQAGNKGNADRPSMTTGEFQDYLKFMGKKLGETASVIESDKENPHAQEIALGIARTAAFVKELGRRQQEKEISAQQAEIEMGRQIEVYRQKREKEQEVTGPTKEGLGILDALVKNLGLSRQIEEIAKGMDGCNMSQEMHNRTPVAVLPERGHGMPLPPRHSGG